jgi:Protein of unknown function (DUF2934)
MTPSLTKDKIATLMQSSHQPIQEAAEQSGQDNESQIAEIAYYKAESRGFASGHEINDWLAAEQEVALSCEG